MSLQQLRVAFEEWNGEPDYVLTVTLPDIQVIPNQLDILYYFGKEVEEDSTTIATMELAICSVGNSIDRVKLMFYVAICQWQQEYERVGKGLANLVWSCLAKDSYFIPNQVKRNRQYGKRNIYSTCY